MRSSFRVRPGTMTGALGAVLVLLLATLWTAALRAETPAPPRPGLAALGWLAGTWVLERDGRVVTEIWMQPEGGTMLGASRTTAGGRTLEHEFILVREAADGAITYTAKPSGQPEATFTLVHVTGREVLFTNPAHDFPQRIRYTRSDDEHLLAVIEGERAGQTRRIEFAYRRVR